MTASLMGVMGRCCWMTRHHSPERRMLTRTGTLLGGLRLLMILRPPSRRLAPALCRVLMCWLFPRLGGPSWNVKLGRRDARTNPAADLKPKPSLKPIQRSRPRIYNENNIDGSLARTRQSNCPRQNGTGDNNLAPLDFQTPTSFDNRYFGNLVGNRGLLHSDQQLFSGSGSTDSIVRSYSGNEGAFRSDFAAAMIKMGDISPLTGSRGEIRRNCRRAN
ncbi:Peroxidase 52 [Linum perenne]